MTPEDCIHQIAKGDETASGLLYDQVGGLLFALARRILNDDQVAGDVLEDVFRTIRREATTFDSDRTNATTWLILLTRQRAIERLRTNRRRLSVIDASTESSPVQTPLVAPAASSPANERREEVADWVSDLPSNQRRAIELAFFEGLTHPEIATRLNETIGAVKSGIRAGLDRLRLSMKGGLR